MRVDRFNCQVGIRWIVQHTEGVAVVFKADKAAYIQEDLRVFDWALTDADVALLNTRTTPTGTPLVTMHLNTRTTPTGTPLVTMPLNTHNTPTGTPLVTMPLNTHNTPTGTPNTYYESKWLHCQQHLDSRCVIESRHLWCWGQNAS